MNDQADILIVEDERRLRFFAGEVFRFEGIASAAVSNGCEAIAYFEDILNQGGKLPRIMLLDMTMPCLSGYEVYQQIAAQPWSADMIVIITSADGSRVNLLPGPAQTLILHKPYEVTKLLETIRTVAPDLFQPATS
ncbi:MAG: response regulator [Chloroflexota bacterium]